MSKRKIIKNKPLPYKSKRPSFKILRITAMIVFGIIMILIIVAVILRYYRLVTKH